MTTTEKLLPCPFCGQEPSYEELSDGIVVTCCDPDCVGCQVSTASTCCNTRADHPQLSAEDLAKVRDTLIGAALRFRLLSKNRLNEAIRPEIGRKEVVAAIEILDRAAKAVG